MIGGIGCCDRLCHGAFLFRSDSRCCCSLSRPLLYISVWRSCCSSAHVVGGIGILSRGSRRASAIVSSVSRQQHPFKALGRLRIADALGECTHLAVDHVERHETRRIDGKQHRTVGAVIAGQQRDAGAGQEPAQHLHHQAQTVTLVPAKGQQRTAIVIGIWVLRWLPVGIYDQAGCDHFALGTCNPQLPLRNPRRSKVHHDRRLLEPTGRSKRKRIRTKDAFAPAIGCDARLQLHMRFPAIPPSAISATTS